MALRICELDSAVQSPTTRLLEGYTSANVDLRCMYNQRIITLTYYLYSRSIILHLFFTGDSDFNDLNHTTNGNVDNIEETNIVTNENNIQCSSSPESQVMQQLQSIQMSLPKNLGVLVQKALNNLKDNDKQKI